MRGIRAWQNEHTVLRLDLQNVPLLGDLVEDSIRVRLKELIPAPGFGNGVDSFDGPLDRTLEFSLDISVLINLPLRSGDRRLVKGLLLNESLRITAVGSDLFLRLHLQYDFTSLVQ